MFEYCHELSGRFCFSSSSFFTPTNVTHLESELISTVVEDLLSKGAIKEVQPSDQGFYSRSFLVTKKEGTQTCFSFELLQPICSQFSFPNGRSSLFENTSARMGLNDK